MSRTRRVLAALAGVALLAGCSYDATPLPEPKPAEETTPAAPSDCTTDESTYASYAPDPATSGPAVRRILDRGRLIVGVSADTYRMASLNPENNQIQGFDIDVANSIGRAIFGADFRVGANMQFRVITAAQRIPLLQAHEVDLVVRNMTINCARWEDIAFSQVYYNATQKVLLRSDLAEYDDATDTYTMPESLAGLRVCAPTGSTSLDNIEADEPDVEIEPAVTHTGCLVKLQNGEVDAITGDDTVLAGLAAQDPYTVVPEQEKITDEPYGVGANQDDEDLVAFVNSVLEEMRDDGSWQRAYRKWLEPYLGPGAVQPEAVTPYR